MKILGEMCLEKMHELLKWIGCSAVTGEIKLCQGQESACVNLLLS